VDPRVERTIQRVEEQLHAPVTVRDLAGAVGLSVSRFSRLFREGVGTTPTAYLRARRMMRARILIERTTLSVAEVRAQVGLSDPSHFARDFRNAHGFSPRTLRVQLRIAGRASRYLAFDPPG
jgi:transcriptional regulator GlxA family with amidase domain